VGVFDNKAGETLEFNPDELIEPKYMGRTLNKIPFIFINTKDIISIPDEPPLLGLGLSALTVYRTEADYRQNLFMQGQDTLVTIGMQRQTDLTRQNQNEPLRTGAGSHIDIELGGDAKYIGVNSQGLSEQRQALENDRKRAEVRAGQFISNTNRQIESGAALQTRIAAQTATLNQIASAGAAALEALLKICAEWIGANPDEIKIEPNLEFANYNMSGLDMVQYMTAKNMGAPLSNESLHALFVERGLTQFDYQTEMDLINNENIINLSGKING
jgi:hypothetical protein